MMTDNELDDLFKNTLGNHEAPVPADMWQRIQPGEDKKRPLVFWRTWYVAAAILVIAGMATWWFVYTSPHNNKPTAATNPLNKQNTAIKAPQNNIKNNNSIATSPAEGKIPSNTNQTNNNHVVTSDTKNTAASASNTDTQNKEGNGQGLRLTATAAKNKQGNDLNAPKPTRLLANNATINNSLGFTDSGSNIISKAPAQASTNISPAEKSRSVIDSNATVIKQNATLNSVSNTATTTGTKKSNKQVKQRWTLELFASSGYADKQTYGVPKVTPAIIGMAAPVPTPQPKPSLWNYSAGVRVGIPVIKNVLLKTGLQFSQMHQKATYQQQNEVDIIAVNGFADTSRYRQLVYETKHQQSTYNALSVPVLISYQRGKKIKVGATAGVIVNAYSWYTGKVPNADYTATIDAKNTYKHNTGVALYAGITAAKKVGAVEIFAEPHLQYSLTNFTKEAVTFKQKFNSYGLAIGVRTALHK